MGGQSCSQMSTCSEIASASTTSRPKYLTVLSILGMSEKELDGAKIAGATIDQRRLGTLQ